jgi:hypothetical protein
MRKSSLQALFKEKIILKGPKPDSKCQRLKEAKALIIHLGLLRLPYNPTKLFSRILTTKITSRSKIPSQPSDPKIKVTSKP